MDVAALRLTTKGCIALAVLPALGLLGWKRKRERPKSWQLWRLFNRGRSKREETPLVSIITLARRSPYARGATPQRIT